MLRTLLMVTLLVLAAGAYVLLPEGAPTSSAQRGLDAPPPALAINTPAPAPFTAIAWPSAAPTQLRAPREKGAYRRCGGGVEEGQ